MIVYNDYVTIILCKVTVGAWKSPFISWNMLKLIFQPQSARVYVNFKEGTYFLKMFLVVLQRGQYELRNRTYTLWKKHEKTSLSFNANSEIMLSRFRTEPEHRCMALHFLKLWLVGFRDVQSRKMCNCQSNGMHILYPQYPSIYMQVPKLGLPNSLDHDLKANGDLGMPHDLRTSQWSLPLIFIWL